MQSVIGDLIIVGFGLLHFGLGILLLVTGGRALQREILPKLRTAGHGAGDWVLSILGGVGWTVVVALFCSLVTFRSLMMVFE